MQLLKTTLALFLLCICTVLLECVNGAAISSKDYYKQDLEEDQLFIIKKPKAVKKIVTPPKKSPPSNKAKVVTAKKVTSTNKP